MAESKNKITPTRISHAGFAVELFDERAGATCMLPTRSKSVEFAERLLKVLFPQFSDNNFSSAKDVESELDSIQALLEEILALLKCRAALSPQLITDQFFRALPDIRATLKCDADAIYRGDPAAQSVDEVIVAYPGFLAIAIYRFAHQFYVYDVPVFPRILSEYAHRVTGVDINAGAKIAECFCIDHGTGVVIGETAVIGKNVKIYQGVTLGAVSVIKNQSSKQRHPTIEENVVIYSNATILGGNTVIGHNSVIGGNVFLTESVPPYATVYHTSEVKVRQQAPDWSI